MKKLCNLKIHINGHHTFFLSQSILCSFSGRLRKMVRHEKRRSKGKGSAIRFMDFPGGADAFELASRFCYNNGRIPMSPSNVCLLHCGAIFLEMNEEITPCNLLSQTETFFDCLFYWTWDDVLTSLKSCEPFISTADSYGLLQKLISCLLVKISANSDIPLAALASLHSSPSSSSSSTYTSGFRCSSWAKTPEIMKRSFSREWWFDDLTVLSPSIIEKMMKELRSYGSDNKNLILTKFLLHYLKSAHQRSHGRKLDYGGLVDTSVHGMVVTGRNVFSCRCLFWVLRVVARFGLGKECREKLEWLIGTMLDMATLDDLLVSGHDDGVYDVDLVMRLVKVFVNEESSASSHRMKKVGRLVDKYLREISPDQSLKVSMFLGMAESLPDSARDCYDGVYRALDIYLESHPDLPFVERTKLCRCLNYEELTLEACKDLAKNPRIPPKVAVEALASQKSKIRFRTNMVDVLEADRSRSAVNSWGVKSEQQYLNEREAPVFNLQKVQKRVTELEKISKETRGQMSLMARERYITSPVHHMSNGLC